MQATLDMAIADRDRALAAKAAVQEYQLARGRLMYQNHGVPGMDAWGQNDGDHSYIQVHYTSSSVCLSSYLTGMSNPSTYMSACLFVICRRRVGFRLRGVWLLRFGHRANVLFLVVSESHYHCLMYTWT